MKRIILVLVVILISTNTLHAANFKWTKIVTTADGATEFYIDKNSVFKVGSYKFYWQLANYVKDYDEDKSVISHSMVNCDTYEMRWITYTGYAGHMGKGTTTFESIVPETDVKYFEWDYFDPETTSQGAVLKKVCKSR